VRREAVATVSIGNHLVSFIHQQREFRVGRGHMPGRHKLGGNRGNGLG